MENKEPLLTEQVTTTEKKTKIQDELQLEKDLLSTTKKQEKRKSRANRSGKLEFQKKTKMKFQKKDHFL